MTQKEAIRLEIPEEDKEAAGIIAEKLATDADFLADFGRDPRGTITNTGLTLTPGTVEQLVQRADDVQALAEDLDPVRGSLVIVIIIIVKG